MSNMQECDRQVALKLMSEKMVCITYWSQETEESGRWVSTGPMKFKDAKNMFEKYPYLFPRGYVDNKEGQTLTAHNNDGANNGVSDQVKHERELKD